MLVQFDVYGDHQINRRLLRFSDRVMDARPAWNAILDHIMAENELHFETEGRSVTPWPPLAASTLDFKRRANYDLRILHRTLDLRRSWTERGFKNYIVLLPHSMTFDSDVGYGIHHQFGAKRANLPMRKPVEFSNTTRTNIMKILQRYIMTGETAVFS